MSFATAFRVDEPRARISERYEETLDALEGALLRLPNDHDRPAEEERVRDVEAPRSFCPGKNALGYNDDGTERKYAGVAQRVTQEAALVSGVVVVESGDEIRRVLSDIYSALGVDFEPETVGGLDDAGFGVSVSRVARGLREALEDEAGGDAGVGRA
ncbi:MAG: hypothetical protein SV760_02425 [Halobacteria archaeon]|nr:hypothetical protein [Halobacteria archaeon]